MNILETKLGMDVLAVINSNANNLPNTEITATLLSGNQTLPLTRVQEQLLTKNYKEELTVDRTLIVSMTVSEYENYVLANSSDLIVELLEYPIKQSGVTEKIKPKVIRYRAKVNNLVNEALMIGDFAGTTTKEKDDNLKHVTLKLTDVVYADFHNTSFQGTVVDQGTVNDVIHCLGSNLGEYHMSVFPPDNTRDICGLVIDDGVKMMQIANWLQEFGVGVYYNGINTFIEDNTVFVYPLFMLEKHPKRKRVVILRCSPNDLIGIETTYSVEGDTVYIISSGEGKMSDDEEALEEILGNAIRWSEPNFLGDKISHKDGTSSNTSRGYYMYAQEQKRETIATVDKLITANKCRQMSKIHAARGAKVVLPWQNMNENVIYPNMEVDIYYMEAGVIKQLSGVIDGVRCVSSRDQDKQVDTFHTSGQLTMTVVPVDKL